MVTKANYATDWGQSLLLGFSVAIITAIFFIMFGYDISTAENRVFFFVWAFVIGTMATFISIFKWKNYR